MATRKDVSSKKGASVNQRARRPFAPPVLPSHFVCRSRAAGEQVSGSVNPSFCSTACCIASPKPTRHARMVSPARAKSSGLGGCLLVPWRTPLCTRKATSSLTSSWRAHRSKHHTVRCRGSRPTFDCRPAWNASSTLATSPSSAASSAFRLRLLVFGASPKRSVARGCLATAVLRFSIIVPHRCDGLMSQVGQACRRAHILKDAVRRHSLVDRFRLLLFERDGRETVVVEVQRRIRVVIRLIALLELFDDVLGVLDGLALLLV